MGQCQNLFQHSPLKVTNNTTTNAVSIGLFVKKSYPIFSYGVIIAIQKEVVGLTVPTNDPLDFHDI